MRLISLPDLRTLKGVPYSRPHLYRLIGAGKFPKPIRLGENRIAFVEAEIDEWLQGRVNDRDLKSEQ